MGCTYCYSKLKIRRECPALNKDFATLLNCMDGRTQLPAITWIMNNFKVEYVDIISEPGMDKLLCTQNADIMNSLNRKIAISLNSHGSKIIFVAGHYDCAANKANKDEHIAQIKKAVDILKQLYQDITVIGLWINEDFQVEKV